MKSTKSRYSVEETPKLVSRYSEVNPSVQLFELPTEIKEEEKPDMLFSPRRSSRLTSNTAGPSKPALKTPKRRASSLSSLSDDGSSDGSTAKVVVRSQRRKRVKVEKTEETSSLTVSVETAVKTEVVTSPKKRAPAKPKGVKHALSVPHPAPEGWQDLYKTIREYRFRMLNVPVDTMGCHTANWKETTDKNKRFITLVSLILSAQTTDESCARAVSQLQEELGGTVSIENVLAASEERIYSAVRPAGFRKKATYLKETAEILRDKFNSDVPNTVEELCTLRGVREKVAFLTLQVAWGINTGIGVDVHVHRITNKLGWHNPPTKDPEETRLNLQSWLPKELYRDINTVFVGYGQMVCLAKSPRCDICPVAHLCPSARTVPAKEKSKAPSREVLVAGPKVDVSFEEILKEAGESVGKPFPPRWDPVAELARRNNLDSVQSMIKMKEEDW